MIICTSEVFVDVQGVKYYARIARIFPPRRSFPSYSIASSSAASASASSSHPPAPHALVSDLMMSQADADRIDDPRAYFYSIQLVESNGTKDERCSDSYMEVTETALSRDRVSFSKTIIKKLLKECIERKGQAVTSPWIVKPAIALQHGIPTEPSEQRKEAIESFQEGVMEKRKRTRPEEEGSAVEVVGPADAKRKKLDNGSATPTTRKKPIKYPAEGASSPLFFI
jgi:bromodomain adjacent to zinc finger domain protein 1A